MAPNVTQMIVPVDLKVRIEASVNRLNEKLAAMRQQNMQLTRNHSAFDNELAEKIKTAQLSGLVLGVSYPARRPHNHLLFETQRKVTK